MGGGEGEDGIQMSKGDKARATRLTRRGGREIEGEDEAKDEGDGEGGRGRERERRRR